MKILLVLSFIFSACVGGTTIKTRPTNMTTEENPNAKTFYSFKMKGIDGKEVDFSQYKGKKVLLVNVASECGYTAQYEQLQALHTKYGEKVTILGFPANNFGGQEPGTNAEVATFCKTKFGVTFQMFEKISVKGKDAHPLYTWLSTKAENGWNEDAPNWNFCKYLVNEKGELVKFFKSGVDPVGDEMLAAIK